MKKKNFILIGLSILVLLISVMLPFIGFGHDGFTFTNLPANLLVSFLLLFIGLKGLYKDTNNQDFYTGSIMCIVGMCVLVIGTIISPLITHHYISLFKYYKAFLENIDNEYIFLKNSLYLFNSFGIFFIVYLVAFYFYGFAAFRFANGIKNQSVILEHKNNLNKKIKTFIITNIILFALSAITMFIFKELIETLMPYIHANTIPDAAIAKLMLLLVVIYAVICPCLIVVSILYYINIIKSIILVFKTPNMLEQKEEFVEVEVQSEE